MRYCFVTYGKLAKNAGNFRALGLGRALIERGIDVTYLVDDVPENHGSTEIDIRASVRFVGRSLGQLRARNKLLNRLDVDYVHVLNPSVKNCLLVTGKRKFKVVADWDEPALFKPVRIGKRQILWALDWWLRGRADLIIACTQYLRDFFRIQYNIDAFYLPHATYLPDRPDGTSPFTERSIVYLGNLHFGWDHDITLEAAAMLHADGLSPPIYILGHGPDELRVRRFLADKGLKNVKLPGYLTGDQLWRHLRHAHALLFPIRDNVLNKTRCPSKTFAYAQARRPIITSRVGEVAAMLGESATYVDATPACFAAAIASALEHDSLADVDYGIEKHSYDARADELLDRLPISSSRSRERNRAVA